MKPSDQPACIVIAAIPEQAAHPDRARMPSNAPPTSDTANQHDIGIASTIAPNPKGAAANALSAVAIAGSTPIGSIWRNFNGAGCRLRLRARPLP